MSIATFLDRYLLNFKYAFNIKKPILIYRLVKTFTKILLFKDKPLRYVDFSISHKCNLQCKHCFATAFDYGDREKMAVSDYRRVANQAIELGACSFSFQGGEPLLDDRLEDIISACYPERVTISVTTNGTLMTSDKLISLKKSGVDILTVSLDSAIPQEHDEFRNAKGTFDKVMNCIDNALACGFKVTIGTTVSHLNLHSEGINKLFELVKQKKLILCLNLATPAGEWSDQKEILLTKEDCLYIRDLVKNEKYIRVDLDGNYTTYGCGAAKEILYLTPVGDVLTCPFIHVTFGNIKENSLMEIRDQMLGVDQFKVYNSKCLCAEDKNFIENYMTRINQMSYLPANYKDIFYKNLE